MVLYKTIARDGFAEYEIKKSKFISYSKRIGFKEDALAFFDYVRKLHPDARHAVPAYVIGQKGDEFWASDDGEPQGTAGKPVLSVLTRKSITNAAVIVVRYFGGIKLGAPGLIRAYGHSANLTIKEAGIKDACKKLRVEYKFDYSDSNAVEKLKHLRSDDVKDIQYKDFIYLRLVMDPSSYDELKRLVLELTKGRAVELLRREEIVLI